MSVVFESLETAADVNADASADAAPGSQVVDSTESVESTVTTSAPAAPVKRPRGRPKGSVNKPKPPAKEPKTPKNKRPPSSSSDSSESDEPRPSKRSVVKHLMEDDMETQVLRFLTARKQNQEKQRRTLWQNLAASGLR